MRPLSLISAVIACSLAIGVGSAKPKAKKQAGGTPVFSRYLLSLSWAPDYCAQPTGDKDPRECGPGRQTGFVVH